MFLYTTMEKEKIREQKLISLIVKQKESEFVDFKQEFYHKEATQDFIKDVISFANAQSNEEKYIIFGVADTYELFDIAYEKIRDISELNQVLKEYCEPFINVEFYRFTYKEKYLIGYNDLYLSTATSLSSSVDCGEQPVIRYASNCFCIRAFSH